MSATDIPRGETGPRFVRLQVELILEVTGRDELTRAALDRIGGDDEMPDEERARATVTVRQDEPEALAYLVDPFDLVTAVPGVELLQASWSCAQTEYDPESQAWDLQAEEEDEDDGGLDEDDGGLADDSDDAGGAKREPNGV